MAFRQRIRKEMEGEQRGILRKLGESEIKRRKFRGQRSEN
jgi:hypothetical protein